LSQIGQKKVFVTNGLRKENPAVSTRTIFLLPIEFFKITHARKATAGKFWPKTTDTARKLRPSGLWRETFYIPLPEKVTQENSASKHRYGWKIWLPVTADPAGKSRQVTTRFGRKIRLSVTTETAGKSQEGTQ
jgi:hypothetical protein